MVIMQTAGIMDPEPRYELFCDYCGESLGDDWSKEGYLPRITVYDGRNDREHDFCDWPCFEWWTRDTDQETARNEKPMVIRDQTRGRWVGGHP